jgi:hypothetical protein
MEGIFRYTVKYGKAWKAKLAAIEILYGGWEELYNRRFMVSEEITTVNLGVYHVVEPLGSTNGIYNAIVRVFGCGFWAFGT